MPIGIAPTAYHERILTAARHAGGSLDQHRDRIIAVPAAEPNRLHAVLSEHYPARVVLTGTLDRRLLVLEPPEGGDRWIVADLSSQPHESRSWPTWTQAALGVDIPSSWLSTATVGPTALHRLTRPRVLLAALYHPEVFPLPRFPLAISDLARAARSTLTGHVEMMDMQLGVTLEQIIDAVATGQPDVVGISATFGQHDLLTELLDAVAELPQRPLVLAGGSLTARNERLLLERYPWLMVARGAGEPTIADVLAHWHGDMELDQVRGIGYTGAPRGNGTLAISFRRNATVTNRAQTDILPELDLLGKTFEHRGVAQLEASRGCTNACSFCPRSHKGSWAGSAPESLPWIVREMGTVFDRYPQVSRTLYLVDEEFIGRGPGTAERALAVAKVLHGEGFRWETSCRVDQIVQPATEERAWHMERARLWRELRARGLRRCLFGVESGVTSILNRFNKETTAEQNALAVRTLSALGVPTRYTYIAFDQLMSPAELVETAAFQARTDLLMLPLPELSVEEIVEGVRDEQFVAEHTTGRPFYTGISYLLVSMECLIGAAYTKQVQAAGLAGAARPAMGRLDAEFADWRIGRFSHHAQLWVDRNFALDYTLKSLEKVLDGRPWEAVRAARVVIKDAAFGLLRAMVGLLERFPLDQPDPAVLDEVLLKVMEQEFADLHTRVTRTVNDLVTVLRGDDTRLLFAEYTRWATTGSWELINAADSCGT
ncbi:MAG: B12-binding domain-containing radical SAM protein [Pseudonocardiaceae bacterium]